MTFCLDSTIVKPENEKDIRYAIILLHGYGGDGKDISMLNIQLAKIHAKYNIYLSKWLSNL